MFYRDFKQLIQRVRNTESRKRVAVVAAQDEHTLQAVFKAARDNIVEPVLIGDRLKINDMQSSLKIPMDDNAIIDAKGDTEAANKAVELIREGNADFIMKGKIQTADLLKAVVNREKGLRCGSIMSQIAIFEIPGYHKLLAVTDGGMVVHPDVDVKKQIIQNAVNTFAAIGYERPKVAVLAAVENVNPKMPETADAKLLKEMNARGEIYNCIVEGPISYDLAVNRESAKIKGYESPVAGDADILVVPDIASGNILGKCLIYSAGAKMAGFVVGAKVPIVLTSRGSSAEEKYLSLVLCASAVHNVNKN